MRYSFFVFVSLFALSLPLGAQTEVKLRPDDPDLPSLLMPVPNVPGMRARLAGLNAAVTSTSVHDSTSGWYTLMTPAVSYAVSPHYSFDVNMPVYLYRLAVSEYTQMVQPPGTTSDPDPSPVRKYETTPLQARYGDLGDLVMASHAQYWHGGFGYMLTPSMTVPTGNKDHGLSTGRVTFDVDNRFQMHWGKMGALLDLGAGDSSTLFNRLVLKDYTSLGPLAHFSTGVQVWLTKNLFFQSVAYEQLPLGDSKIYTTYSRPGAPDRTFITGRSVSEDNGFTSMLMVPLNSHMTMQSYYNRSLRLKMDTVSVGVTFSLRSNHLKRRSETNVLNDLLR